MARFLVWSDLHDEFWGGFDLPDLSAPVDGVLIAGDTHTRGRHLEIPARAAGKYGCPVVVIWGNHEPYGSVWAELLAEEERQLAVLRAEGLDIRVLHGATTEIAGVRIIGGHEKRAMNNGFASDLWEKIRGFDVNTWVWGHSHEGESRTIEGDHGPIRFVTNQRGYPGEEVEFDPAYVLEV